jgi:hypothetical protein
MLAMCAARHVSGIGRQDFEPPAKAKLSRTPHGAREEFHQDAKSCVNRCERCKPQQLPHSYFAEPGGDAVMGYRLVRTHRAIPGIVSLSGRMTRYTEVEGFQTHHSYFPKSSF